MSKERKTAYSDKYEKSKAPGRDKRLPDLGAATPTTTTTTSEAKETITQQQQQRRVEVLRETGGVSIHKISQLSSATIHKMIFNGKLTPTLTDIVITNTHASNSATYSIFISMLDLRTITQKNKTISQVNSILENSNNTALLVNGQSLAAKASTTLSASVGGLLSNITGSNANPFFVYIALLTGSSVTLDATVIK